VWLRAGCELHFQVGHPTPFILMLRPRSGPQQWVARESYTLTPSVPSSEYTDGYGNLCQRLSAPPGAFCVATSAEVQVPDAMDTAPGAPFDEIHYLPDAVLAYLLPSRYCESDRFGARVWEVVGDARPGYDQVVRIVAWVRAHVRYVAGSSATPVSAGEALERGAGVCRDLSHICIALCRALAIPARLVVGYLHELEPLDVHAWLEAWVGGRWYTFDPTEAGPPRGGRLAIAYGRDAADVAVYNQFGPPLYPDPMCVHVERL